MEVNNVSFQGALRVKGTMEDIEILSKKFKRAQCPKDQNGKPILTLQLPHDIVKLNENDVIFLTGSDVQAYWAYHKNAMALNVSLVHKGSEQAFIPEVFVRAKDLMKNYFNLDFVALKTKDGSGDWLQFNKIG